MISSNLLGANTFKWSLTCCLNILHPSFCIVLARITSVLSHTQNSEQNKGYLTILLEKKFLNATLVNSDNVMSCPDYSEAWAHSNKMCFNTHKCQVTDLSLGNTSNHTKAASTHILDSNSEDRQLKPHLLYKVLETYNYTWHV